MGVTRTFRMPQAGKSMIAARVAAVALFVLIGIAILIAVGLGKKLPSRSYFEIVVMPLLMGAVLWGQWRLSRSGRLVIDDEGVRVQSDLPEWLSWLFSANWALRWSEIARVTVVARLGVIQFQRKDSIVKRAVRAFQWLPAETVASPSAKPRLLLRARDIRTNAVWQALEERGVLDSKQDADFPANFDLAKHPATRAALVVMALLATYWAVDSFVPDERWAEDGPVYLSPHAMVGGIGALFAFAALVQARRPAPVPRQVAALLSLFVGLCVALASWCALIQVNKVVGGPLEPHAYVRNVSCDVLEPVEAGLPPIEYSDQAIQYWCSFPREHRHTVLVRRGLGGLYQVDLSEHTRAIRAYRGR